MMAVIAAVTIAKAMTESETTTRTSGSMNPPFFDRRGLYSNKPETVKILGASPEAFEFPDLKIEGTKQASGN